MKQKLLITIGLLLTQSPLALAVTSVIARHQSSTDFLKGQPTNVIIDSSGTLRLGQQSQPVELDSLLGDVWSIHALYADAARTLYLGTGPNAKVIRFSDGKAEQLYPPVADAADNDDSILNQHVFAIAQDLAGRLLVAVSGDKGKLVRLANGQPETIFEDDRVQYIFAVALDSDNNIYLATGPNGLLIRLDPFGQNPEVVFDAKDRSLLSLAVHNNMVYAGGDQRGLVYRIDPQTQRAAVLYDADQDEISSLLVDADGTIYAAATTAGAAMLQLQIPVPALKKSPGRPDSGSAFSGSTLMAESVKTEGSEEEAKKEEPAPARPAPLPPAVRAAGHIYKINPDGFVTDVFSEMAVLYSLTQSEGKLWLATGNKGQLFTVDPATEEAAVFYENKTSSQVSAVVHVGTSAYLGLSNPAQLVRVSSDLYASGTFESAFLDAGQPARWGKLQVEAAIPDGAAIAMSCRSGNVNDPNDQTFSPWSEPVSLSDAADLNCPPGRFCQYRLTLTASPDGQTPVIRQVAAAYVIPNLAPRVAAVKVERSRDKKKLYAFDISFAAADENKDTLDYKLEFRKAGNTVWIPLKDQLDQPRFEWDTRTVEDGRYEVRVTADDDKSNTPETALTGSRISDVFVIDNSAPEIRQAAIDVQGPGSAGVSPAFNNDSDRDGRVPKEGKDVTLKLTVEDAWSVLGKVQYTIDSNENWLTALPDDLVYDTLSETFTMVHKDVKSGRHVVAVMIADDAENTMYKSWEVDVP